MKSVRVKVILSLIFLGQLASACSNGPVSNSNSTQNRTNQNSPNAASDKVEELGMLVVLPMEPEETVFREDPAIVSTDGTQPQYSKKLTAVLKYPAPDADKLSALIEKSSPPLSASVNTETWFPAELIAQSDLSGDDTLKGDSFAAADFYQAPYTDGKITRVEGSNYFILELFSK
jgi:hypothetical protein